MAFRRRAKITVDLDRLGFEQSKYFVGTEDEVLYEAHDWMHAIALQFIQDNDIEEPWEQDLILAGASHTIEWENEDPICMFAVAWTDNCDDNVYGVYPTRSDAEEAILSECENWAYEVLMRDDPMDVFGAPSWDYALDYKWLMEDCAASMTIYEVPVFGIQEVAE